MIPRAAAKFSKLVRCYRQRFKLGAVILLYHRIIDLPSDPYLLNVSPSHFAEHLTVLGRATRPLGLRQLVDGLRDKKVPRNGVVITFDDGYVDNLINAKPLLERHDTAATVFVTPGSLQDGREFWWDTLEKVLLQTRSLPPTLCLVIRGIAHEWQLGSAAEWDAEDYIRYRSWNYGRKDDPTPRHAIFRSIHLVLHGLDESEQRKILQDLTNWASADTSIDSGHRKLTAAETIRLAEGQLIEVGAHTMTHPVLSRLSVAKQRAEIRQSKMRLEELIGRPVSSFAYPHGLNSDFTSETEALVRDAGFACGCAAVPGIVHRGTSVYRLPRLMVRDEDGDRFAERLSAYFQS